MKKSLCAECGGKGYTVVAAKAGPHSPTRAYPLLCSTCGPLPAATDGAEVEWLRVPHDFAPSLDGQSCRRCGYFQPHDSVARISICYEENRAGEKRFVADIEVRS